MSFLFKFLIAVGLIDGPYTSGAVMSVPSIPRPKK